MFEISDDAMELILGRLEAATAGRMGAREGMQQVGLRLNLRQGGAHLSLEAPRPTDQVMSFMGRTLLIIDRKDYSRLVSTRLVVERGPNGKSLSMEPATLEKAA